MNGNGTSTYKTAILEAIKQVPAMVCLVVIVWIGNNALQGVMAEQSARVIRFEATLTKCTDGMIETSRDANAVIRESTKVIGHNTAVIEELRRTLDRLK